MLRISVDGPACPGNLEDEDFSPKPWLQVRGRWWRRRLTEGLTAYGRINPPVDVVTFASSTFATGHDAGGARRLAIDREAARAAQPEFCRQPNAVDR